MSRYAVVAGGGTGGHVLLALATARAVAARGHDPASIELVGSRRGQEADLLAGQGFPVTLFPGRGITRRMDAAAARANIGAAAGLVAATARALRLLARDRPRVVVSVGGYASFPADVAALVLGVPLVLVNIDAVPGLVHRLLGRFAAASAVSFPGTPLPRAVVTGTAVREEIVAAADRSPDAVAQARTALHLPGGRPVVGVVGGSLGAGRLNEAATALARRWAGREDVALYHVVGRRNWDAVVREVDGPLVYRPVPFEDRMGLLYQACDVLVCRAGAVTVAEVAVAGVPAVLVPLPGAPGDHQTANARALVGAGAGVLLPDDQCDGAALAATLEGLLADPGRLRGMSDAARGLGRPDAADRLAEVVADCAR
ncbi:MAG: UDP-N-acetylglucosamine--N-acetylmuramyl-(pentapeptide) pyrophosphoryl-undecaprenol N-acetylglucosamine transferase [Acidimicrobiales bacterium]